VGLRKPPDQRDLTRHGRSRHFQVRSIGDEAWLYFECHDVGDYDLPARAIASDTLLAGTVRKVAGRWVFSTMTAGASLPLYVNHYHFP
jgi:hypothetical protein